MNLFFHQQALGDFVVAWPTLRALLATGPTAVVAPYSHAQLASRVLGEGVEPVGIESFEFTRMYAPGGPSALSPRVADLFASARRVVSFLSDGQDVWADNARRLMPAATLLPVSPRPPQDWREHVADWHRSQLIDAPPIDADDKRIPLISASSDGMALLHPGSGGLDKCWPVERWTELWYRLRKRGRRVHMLFGPAERERFTGSAWRAVLDKTDAVISCDTLDALVDRLREASVYIGNDAGPTHLAAAMGLPTLAIFGPSNPTHWRPLGVRVAVLSPTTPCAMDWLEVDRVEREADALLEAL